jgi:hypothetical protein
MTNEQLIDLEHAALAKLHDLISGVVITATEEHVVSCIHVLEFCRNSGTHSTIYEDLLKMVQNVVPQKYATQEKPWPLVPKMPVQCTCEGALPDGTIRRGLIGLLLPSSSDGSGKVLWAVSINGERLWDDCDEERIREDFEPLIVLDPNNSKPRQYAQDLDLY